MNFSSDDDRYIYEIVSKNIKYYRKIYNKSHKKCDKLTQEKLAEACDLSNSLISNIESNKVYQSFSLAVLYRIANCLGVDIKNFFDEKRH